MRILHFVRSFPKLSLTFVRRFVDKSLQFSEQVSIVTFNKTENSEYISERIPIHQLDEYFTRKSIKGSFRYLHQRVSNVPYWHRQLLQCLNTYKPDVVHCHFGTMGVSFSEFAIRNNINIPFITTFYGYDASSLPQRDQEYRMNLKKLWSRGSSFLAEGPALASKLEALGVEKHKLFVNPLLIPMEEYPRKQVFRRQGEPLKFLLVGRFLEKKGFHLFFEALGQLKDELPDFTVSVIGYGQMEDNYRHIIEQYDYVGKVRFLGGKSHIEVIEALRTHDFFVHPSLTAKDGDSEGGAPTIILEAQAVGTPVITSDHADIPFVMGYHDFMAKEHNLSDLKQVLTKAINFSNWPQYATIGMEKVKQQHNFDNTDTYFSIVEKLVS